MKDIKLACIIEASRAFLKECLTVELLEGEQENLLAFINAHKTSMSFPYKATALFEMITNLADSQERFLNANLGTVLEQSISLEDLDVISNAISADIWYDAAAHNDAESAQIIEDTKNSMDVVSSKLHELIVKVAK